MVIGFSMRELTVYESEADPGHNFAIGLPVFTQRKAERRHRMVFRVQQSASNATVEPISDIADPLFDALFGARENPDDPDDPIQELFDLERLQATIEPRTVEIRNDLRPEDKEVFIVRISSADVEGRRDVFHCNEDDSNATNYYCEITIYIIDDDGKFIII